ncbi:MAG TPA: maleylpyruvate isomerase N-terminal domain-containing protein [Acidimicrobiia bacterium]
MPDLAAAYTETRDRLVELVRPLDEPGVAAIVPATPAWTIKDVIAHLTHVAGAYATGHHSYQPKT